jgi:hypothetical protein
LAQQRLQEMLAGQYTPAQQQWFQRSMNPQMARLQQMGILRSGGAGTTLARVGGELSAQLQQQALQEALGLGGRQRGYGQWGQEMGQRRYGMEGEWDLQRWMQQQRAEEAKKQRKADFWRSLMGVGGAALGAYIGRPPTGSVANAGSTMV